MGKSKTVRDIRHMHHRSCTIVGLDTFKKTLERDFFAQASIECSCCVDEQIDLVVHLNCNFGLTESLFYLNNGNWGNFSQHPSHDVQNSPMQRALYAINEDNASCIDIRELSIHLKDISIVISRVPNLRIADSLEGILVALSANFVHITKALTEMPYEIFVPIFEEEDALPNAFKHQERLPKHSYCDYWGLYFDGFDDAQVYDVNNKEIIDQSDFFLLNDLSG